MTPGNQYTSVLCTNQINAVKTYNYLLLYRSESPSQVFFILQWLLSMINPLNPKSKPNVTLAYDNICNLDQMKVAKHPLASPKLLDIVWMDVTKIIDVFHFSITCQRNAKKIQPRESEKRKPIIQYKLVNKHLFGLERLNTSYVLYKTHLFYLHRNKS